MQELQSQRQEEALKAEKWLFECRTLEEKYEAVVKEKEVGNSPVGLSPGPFPKQGNRGCPRFGVQKPFVEC